MGRRIVVRRVTARVRDGSAAVTEELLTVGSAHGAERVALRAGLTVLLSLGTLAAIGHFPWALYATFGAFASIYGGRMPVAGRWRTQLAVGVLFTLCVGIGALVGVSPERELVGVPVTAVVAALVYGRGSSVLLALVAGTGFSLAALAARAVHVGESRWRDLAVNPLVWVVVVAGILGALLYARSLERGEVGPATAALWVVEVVLPGLVGVAVLGDAVRPGWGLAALAGVAAAIGGCVVLAHSPAQG